MSEVENAPLLSAEQSPAAEQEASFGARLAAERQRLGFSLAEMGSRLRLHPRQIEAIEQEAFERLPGGPFVRGFIRNYARELKLDPEPLLAELTRKLAPSLEAAPALEESSSLSAAPPPPGERAAVRERRSRRLVLFLALAVLTTLAIIGALSPPGETPPDAAANSSTQAPAAAASATPASTATATKIASDSESKTTAAPAPQAEEVAPNTAPAETRSQAAEIAAAAPAPASQSALRLVFGGESWVEVIAGDGTVLLSQLNPAGSEQRIDGTPPLKLVIGNASDVTLEYKGKRIDLASRTSAENVARVTLN